MARDNFSKSTINTLRERVNNFCSNPDCNVSTRSSHTESCKTTSIGIAAHINAASKNGPRYNRNMSTYERKDIANAIWLCCNCATMIDKDEKKFPIDLLNNWKVMAEKRVSQNHGIAYFTYNEAKNKFEEWLINRRDELQLLVREAIQPSIAEKIELDEITNKLKNIEESYEQELSLRREIEETLLIFKNKLPDEILRKAQEILFNGDTSNAEDILNSFINESESNLIKAYIGCGKIAEQNYEYKKALSNYEKASILSSLEPSITIHTVLLAYKLGNYELAMALINKGLVVINNAPKEKSIFLNQKGLIQRAMGEYDAAIITFEQALAIAHNEIIDDDSYIDNTSSNLALTYISKCNYDMAKEIYKNLIVKDTCKYGRRSWQVCISLSALGTINEKENKIQEAKEMYEESYSISSELFGEEHAQTLTSLNNLGLINININPKEAEKTLKTVLKLRTKQYGESNILTIITCINIASCYTRQEKYLKANKLLLRTLSIAIISLGELHPETIKIKHNLALSMANLDNIQEAVLLLEKVVADRTKVLGVNSPQTQLSRDALSELNGTNTVNRFNAVISSILTDSKVARI
ncbi:tetratricopeptide repeat protein [Pectobacterium versatile]|uniref:tetratricopeptide repeat protein n=1 Tax=Pectobacterium versatile TaxID=2488639 RepID=UPI000D6093EE|nr:tetratricopeptide repeat protein [Pectobacterium versatile]PWD73022.1 tetratricopeptide repeat protein [Pectobacterium versatile]